jgi:3-oxoacyl-[acyl-carrier protein] reductase
MDLNLKGRAALVTGGGRDVGRQIALALAADGAMVAVNFNRSREEADEVVKEITSAGGRALAVQADISDLQQVRRMIDTVVESFGRLDILVNNAGLVLRQRFVESNPEDWHAQINTCLYGTIHCCHAAAPHLEAGKVGRIVTLVGDSSRVGESGLAIAAAARAGNVALMKSLARELGRSGVTANVVSLGIIETSHFKEWVDANRDKLTKLYPLRRLGTPEDVAPTVAFLASDRAAWTTGQVISVSGGYCMP